MYAKATIVGRTAKPFLNLPQPSAMVDYASPKLPYSPLVTKELGQIAELTKIACTYLEDTGDDSLRAQISTLELHHQPNIDAALKLLQGAKKARVLHTTLELAKNLKKAKTADELEKSVESARKLLRWLEPDEAHAGNPELIMTFAIAKLVVHVVGNRQQNHSDELYAGGREPLHFKVNISLLFEAFEDIATGPTRVSSLAGSSVASERREK